MKIQEESDDVLELRGIPHGVHWMVFSMVLGVSMSAFCIYLIKVVIALGENLSMLPLGIGVLFGLFFSLGLCLQIKMRASCKPPAVLFFQRNRYFNMKLKLHSTHLSLNFLVRQNVARCYYSNNTI